jgi:hypothetical protein
VGTINHFKQNRPVHLALRDVYYEQANKLLSSHDPRAVQPLNAAEYEEILSILRTARKHGYFAARDNEKDGQFCDFINMLAGNVKAILSMLNLKHSVEAKDGFFFAFLDVNRASVALQAEEYERRARDIICCLLNTLDIAEEAYSELKQNDLDALGPTEKPRYDKAAEHHRELIQKRANPPEYRKRTSMFF